MLRIYVDRAVCSIFRLYRKKLGGVTMAKVRSLPPTSKAAEVHVKRAYLQVSFTAWPFDLFILNAEYFFFQTLKRFFNSENMRRYKIGEDWSSPLKHTGGNCIMVATCLFRVLIKYVRRKSLHCFHVAAKRTVQQVPVLAKNLASSALKFVGVQTIART